MYTRKHMQSFTSAARRLWMSNTFTYLVTDSHAHPHFIYVVRNVWFVTFRVSVPPKMGPMSLKFKLSQDFSTVHLTLSFIILYLIIW